MEQFVVKIILPSLTGGEEEFACDGASSFHFLCDSTCLSSGLLVDTCFDQLYKIIVDESGI